MKSKILSLKLLDIDEKFKTKKIKGIIYNLDAF